MSQCLQHPDTGFQIQGSNKPNKLLKQQVKDFFTLWKILKSPSKQKVTFYPFFLEYLNFQSYIPLHSQQAEETKKKRDMATWKSHHYNISHSKPRQK